VVLPAHDLGRHIARRPRRLLRVVGTPLARDAEVGDAQVPALFEDQVLGLDVSVEDAVAVDELESRYDAGREEL
jgi:hypothetical protein